MTAVFLKKGKEEVVALFRLWVMHDKGKYFAHGKQEFFFFGRETQFIYNLEK
jgi:hypothetical protein